MALIAEFIVPFILGLFYPQYSEIKNAMGKLSNIFSPVRWYYRIWQVLVSVVFVFLGINIYTSVSIWWLGLLMLGFICIFVVGAKILPTILSFTRVYQMETTLGYLNDFSQKIGSVCLQMASILTCTLFFIDGNLKLGALCSIISLAGIFLACINRLSHHHAFKDTIFAIQGIWEKSFLLCTYFPFGVLAISHII